MNHSGLHAYRLKPEQGNPREVAFAEQWEIENNQGNVLDWLCGDGSKKSVASMRDIVIAATVVQWLGSNVGISFIQEAAKRSPELKNALKHL